MFEDKFIHVHGHSINVDTIEHIEWDAEHGIAIYAKHLNEPLYLPAGNLLAYHYIISVLLYLTGYEGQIMDVSQEEFDRMHAEESMRKLEQRRETNDEN